MSDFILQFLLQYVHINFFATKAARHFLLQVLANQVHQLFRVAQINKAATNDIRARHQATATFLHCQHYHKHTFLAHVNTVF